MISVSNTVHWLANRYSWLTNMLYIRLHQVCFSDGVKLVLMTKITIQRAVALIQSGKPKKATIDFLILSLSFLFILGVSVQSDYFHGSSLKLSICHPLWVPLTLGSLMPLGSEGISCKLRQASPLLDQLTLSVDSWQFGYINAVGLIFGLF